MKSFFFALFLLTAGVLSAENLLLETWLYQSAKPDSPRKTMNYLLSGERSQKLFHATILCAPQATSSCSLVNHFGFQKAGFSLKITPSHPKTAKKNYRIETTIDWNLMEAGPYLASTTESFYEGTVINCVRNLLPGIFSPLGISQAKNVQAVYIPAIKFQTQQAKSEEQFTRRSRWEIMIRMEEEGKPPKTIRTIPVYHRGKFPARNPAGVKCRMYQFQSLTVMNLYYCFQRGVRKDGSPVLEEMDLSLCFKAPEKGRTVQLAELTSYCAAENCAYGKMPAKGGKTIKYQIFLTVK